MNCNFSKSVCVSLGVWSAISSARVSAGSSVSLLSDWTRTKWTKRPQNTVELFFFFFVEIYKGSYLFLNLFFVLFLEISDDWFQFSYSVFSIFQCHSAVFVDLNAIFINSKQYLPGCSRLIFKWHFWSWAFYYPSSKNTGCTVSTLFGLKTSQDTLLTSLTFALETEVSIGFRVEC